MSNKKILIVDDEESTLEIESIVLTLEGYEVLTANNGEEAINLLKKSSSPPNLIILDVLMPKISGIEVCGWIKQQPNLKNIPVIFLSALVSPEDIAEGKNAGGEEYLKKPYSTEELLQMIDKYINIKVTN